MSECAKCPFELTFELVAQVAEARRADPERLATSEAVATDDTGMMAAAGYTLFTSVPHRMRAQTRSCRT